MFSALFSFLGGSVFRMILGEVSDWLKKKQEHAQEMDRMRLESSLEAERHSRDMDRIRLQYDLKVQEVKVIGDIAVEKAAADAFTEAMKHANQPTGIRWVDGWNASIRPAAATIALALWILALGQAGFITNDWDRELIGAIFGFFFADRALGKKGK